MTYRDKLDLYGAAKRETTMLRALLDSDEIPAAERRELRRRLRLSRAREVVGHDYVQRLVNHAPEENNMREILRLRYVMLMPWQMISDLLHLDRRWVLRLHKRAIAIFDTPDSAQ